MGKTRKYDVNVDGLRFRTDADWYRFDFSRKKRKRYLNKEKRIRERDSV